MLVDADLVAARLMLVNHDPLVATLERLAVPSVTVRNAGTEDIDGARDLVMDQLTRYHRLDPTFYRRLADWGT